jgi:hypothetical protein
MIRNVSLVNGHIDRLALPYTTVLHCAVFQLENPHEQVGLLPNRDSNTQGVRKRKQHVHLLMFTNTSRLPQSFSHYHQIVLDYKVFAKKSKSERLLLLSLLLFSNSLLRGEGEREVF